MSKKRSKIRPHVQPPTRQIPRLVIWGFGLAGLVALLTLTTLLFPFIRDLLEGDTASNQNVTWLQTKWVEAEPDPAEVTALTAILNDNAIEAIYLQTNRWHGLTGEYIELPYISNFLVLFREQAPDIQVYAWLMIDPDKLADPASRQMVVDFALRAVTDLGFDGIHLHARAVPDNSLDYLDLLRDLREAIGDDPALSIAVPPDHIPADPDVPRNPVASPTLNWSRDYKARLLLYVDEIVLMAHASGLTDAGDYQAWVAYQVADYASILDEMALDTRYLVAIPTYAAEIGHDPVVENPATAINGILRDAGAARQVHGVGLYPWEETELAELNLYWERWVQRDQ